MAVNTGCSLTLCPLLLDPGIVTVQVLEAGVSEFLVPKPAQAPHEVTRSPVPGPYQAQTTPLFSRLLKGPRLYTLQILACPKEASPLKAAPRLHPASQPYEAEGKTYSFATLANNTKLDIRELLREEKQPKSPSSTGGEITHWIHTIEHYPSVTLNTQTWTHRRSPTLSKGHSSQESVYYAVLVV